MTVLAAFPTAWPPVTAHSAQFVHDAQCPWTCRAVPSELAGDTEDYDHTTLCGLLLPPARLVSKLKLKPAPPSAHVPNFYELLVSHFEGLGCLAACIKGPASCG